MTVEEIFSRLSTHMAKGLMIHNQIANGFGFLNLYGYRRCHEYHYFEESKNYFCLRNYYFDNYGKLIPENSIGEVNIVPQLWYKYTKSDVDIATKRKEIRNLFEHWINWEIEAKKLFETSYKELIELGEIAAALKISDFLRETSHELSVAQSKQIYLASADYDMTLISEEQSHLYKKYNKEIEGEEEND